MRQVVAIRPRDKTRNATEDTLTHVDADAKTTM